ncbi:MAG: GNAT family N-acetyltransferase [Thermoleophilia bacterium]|nr:GNAT family N-acetyltransferase [Thermoleophilia bacterium]
MSASPADGLIVRVAAPADAEALARVHVESWRSAYRRLLPPDYLDALTVAARTPRWRQRLRHVGPRESVVAAERDGVVVGFASAGPSRDPDCDGRVSGELYAIYLLEHEWGRSTGRALHDAAIEALRDARFADAMLWVLAANERARRFYERQGWAADGTTKVESYGVRVTEVRYRRAL